MRYLGYDIFVEVNVITACDFEVDDRGRVTALIAKSWGDLLTEHTIGYRIESPEDKMFLEFTDTLEQAKKLIEERVQDAIISV